MKRLIWKLAKYDISKLISNEKDFCNYINDSLSYISDDDFNKCFSKNHKFSRIQFVNLPKDALDELARHSIGWLIKNDKSARDKINEIVNNTTSAVQLISDIILYIKRNVYDKKSIYKGIQYYFFTEHRDNESEENNDESSIEVESLDELKTVLKQNNNSLMNMIGSIISQLTEQNFIGATKEEAKKIQAYVSDQIQKIPNKQININEYKKIILNSINECYWKLLPSPPILRIIISFCEKKYNIDFIAKKQIRSELYEYLKDTIFKKFKDTIDSCDDMNTISARFNISLDVKEKNIDNKSRLSKYTIQEIKNLPQLSNMTENDNVGDDHNISLVNFFNGKKVVITEEGKIVFNSSTNSSDVTFTTCINTLQKQQMGYICAVIVNNIMCIYSEHNINNLDNVVNIIKNNPSINKIYKMEKHNNFAVNIIRKARLAKLLWKK